MAKRPARSIDRLKARLAALPGDVADDVADTLHAILDAGEIHELAPHLVAGVIQITTYTETRPDGTEVTGSTASGLMSCPDCRHGLVSTTSGVMACSRIPAARVGSMTIDGQPGDVLACGEVRNG